MLMPKRNRVSIYEYLFKEGVMVAEKNVHLPKHPDVDVPNLHVIKALTSLKSRGYVKEQFAWRHHYWTLTNEGIQYLREFLHLPPEIVPSTLKRQSRPDTGRRLGMGGSGGPRADGPRTPEDRATYRRGPVEGGDKTGEAGPGGGSLEFRGDFRGGFGRGRARPPQ